MDLRGAQASGGREPLAHGTIFPTHFVPHAARWCFCINPSAETKEVGASRNDCGLTGRLLVVR